MDDRVRELERALDYRFRRPELLVHAMTHPGAAMAREGGRIFQRLEFLGDRVLALVIAELLLESHPEENEGDLTHRLHALVRFETVARVARDLGIDRALDLAKGEAGGATPVQLADACEAVLGAVFSDGGLASVAKVIRARWTPLLAEAGAPPRDPKMALQEWAQARGKPLPRYDLVARSGPDHAPEFRISVAVEGEAAVEGKGASKRAAEQAAAAALLARLGA